MQPWSSASQRAAQQSQQDAARAAQHTARSGQDAAHAAAKAAWRAGQRGPMRTGTSDRRRTGGGFLSFVGTLVKLAVVVAIIAVAVRVIGGA